jgi:hypothetical protein
MRLRDVLTLVLIGAAIAVLDHFGSDQNWGSSVAVGVVVGAASALGVAIRCGPR